MLSRLMTRREQFVLAFFGVAIVIGSLAIYMRDNGESTTPLAPEETPPSEAAAIATKPKPVLEADAVPRIAVSAPEIVVSVQGAVRRPGMYTFEAGQRVQDAIARAGGLADLGDTASLNLASKLLDATTLTVPKKEADDSDSRRILRKKENTVVPNPAAYTLAGSITTTSIGESSAGRAGISGADGRININTATQAELESLPGIGPAYASAIIARREQQRFGEPEELMEVRGIGEKRFASIKGLITVD